MRTFTASQSATMLSSDRAEHVRVRVWDSVASTLRDLSTYAGFDMVLGVRLSNSLDNVCAEAEVELIREQDWVSCAPLMQSSPLNLSFTPGGTYGALIRLNQLILVDVAVIPADTVPASADWMNIFFGYTDEIDVGGGKTLRLHARDGAARLVDAFIEDERFYGVGTDGSPAMVVGACVWTPNYLYAVGDYCIPTDTNRPTRDNIYKCTAGGSSGSTEPAWPASSTVSDGTVTWTYVKARTDSGHAVEEVMKSIIANSSAADYVGLQVPSSPGWNILSYIQERTGAMDAIKALAQQIGWDVRWKINESNGDWYLYLYEPARASTTALNTFTAADYSEVTQALQRLDMIRNTVRIVYSDRAALDAAGNPTRKMLTVGDSTSINNYGQRFMEIGEASTPNIDSSSEATAMANAALSDLKDPYLEHTVALVHGFPWVELGDLYQFNSNDRHYSANQKLAVVAYEHDIRDGRMKTRLTCLGKPTLGVDTWHSLDGRQPGVRLGRFGDLQQLAGFALTATPIVGGARLTIGLTSISVDALNAQFAFYVSTSNGFTPSTSNKVAESRGQQVELTNLIPGTTYYARAIPTATDRSGRIVLGSPTPQISFVAGRSQSGHLDSTIETDIIPANGSFESIINVDWMPDHWNVVSGSLGPSSNIRVTTGAGSYSGSRYIALYCASGATQSAEIESDRFRITASQRYELAVFMKGVSGTDNCKLELRFYDYSDSYISSIYWDIGLDLDTGAYFRRLGCSWDDGPSPSGARFGRVRIGLRSMSQLREAHIDSVQVTHLLVKP